MVNHNGAVTYKRIKVTYAERTKYLQKNLNPVREVECRRRSRKERIRTEQVTGKKRPTNVRVTD